MEIEHLLQQVQPAMPGATFDDLKQALSNRIAYLIDQDFERLVRLLYTIDVDEKVLKHLLQQQADRPAADLIADLMMERQLQKIAYRQQAKRDATDTGEERW